MNILCATDDGYIPWLGIMLTSLFENNRDVDITVYVLTSYISDENSSKLEQLANIYGQKIVITPVCLEDLGDCPIRPNDHVSLATYYRLLAADVLPKTVKKVIYLDADIIVADSLRYMWRTDLDGKMLGAVIDENYQSQSIYDRLGYPADKKYTCAGVLIIDLEKWRAIDATKKCAECIANESDKLLFHDQDVINMLFHDEIKWIHPRYNLQKGFLFTTTIFHDDVMGKINEAIEHPAIIHYTGPSKPWYEGCKNPYTPYFLKYHALSMWHDVPLLKNRKSVSGTLRNILYEIVWRLGIKKRPQSYIIPNQYPQ